MTRTMMAVIDELSGHGDAQTQTLAAGRSIACVAGRGPFDDAVTAMLGQILERQGFAPRIIAHHSATRDEIARLDLSGVDTVIVSYLELTGSPAHLRFLIRRLRHRAPKARIMIGLWPEGEAALSDAAIQVALGADDYVGSLRAAAEALLGTEVESRSEISTVD